MNENTNEVRQAEQGISKKQELKAFLLLTVVMAPVLAVLVVGGYGFFVWMYQLITGTLPTG
jgi:periplasmic nitrate reductase NapE